MIIHEKITNGTFKIVNFSDFDDQKHYCVWKCINMIMK